MAEYQDLMNSQMYGKEIVPNSEGYPVSVVPPDPVPTWDTVRAKRNVLLTESDWTDLPNTPLSNKQEWLDYRQALRDIPSTFTNPEDVVWPTKPE